MGGGHLELIYFAPTCSTLVTPPHFTLLVSYRWSPVTSRFLELFGGHFE